MRMNTTLVINSKGGSGKTTITTNLAAYFASAGTTAAIMDYDPQGSCLNWLRLRGPAAGKIHGANAAPQKTGLRSLHMHVPAETKQLVIDAPAGASGMLLQEMLGKAQCIIVPVQPSAIDIHATANFIRDLLLSGRLRARNVRLAVVANRVRRSSPVYQPLERFLASLNLPFLAKLADSEVYVESAETGTGIFEMEPAASAAEREQFLPIPQWVDPTHKAAPAEATVIELSRPRWGGTRL